LHPTSVLTNLPPQARAPAFNAARAYASDAKSKPTDVSSILEQRIRGVQEENSLAETGRVLSVGYAASHHRAIAPIERAIR
jgi:hypothetical protein